MKWRGYAPLQSLTLEDLPALVELDRASFEKPWTPEHLAEEISHPDATLLGIWSSSRLVSAIIARQMFDECWIFRIMTHPDFRGQGYARRLIEKLAEPELWLEVDHTNTPAIALYQSLGFVTVSCRKNYYGNTDAIVMKRDSLDYELLDSGDGKKWERFGSQRLIRTDVEATWPPREPVSSWLDDAPTAPWPIRYGKLTFELKRSSLKNIGIFPEQVDNWRWLSASVARLSLPRILNLFAYTGGATMVCAQAGASVCHVDAAKSVIRAASRNCELSALSDKPIRWIVDDAMQFLRREIKRGSLYDGVILDPPPIGRSANATFTFEKHIRELLALCRDVLVKEPQLFLLNCYALHYTPKMAAELVREIFPSAKVECGELTLKGQGQSISCSVYARFAA